MRYKRSQLYIIPLLVILDVFFIGVSLYLSYQIRFFSPFVSLFPISKGLPDWSFYGYALYFVVPLWIFIFSQLGFYKNFFPALLDELIRIARGVTVGIFFLVLATFFYREFSYSRMVFLLFWGLSILNLFIYRELFKIIAGYLMRSFFGRENVLIVGKKNLALKSILKKRPNYQAVFLPSDAENEMEKIKRLVMEKNISQVIVTHKKWSEQNLIALYDWCENQKVDLKLVPDIVHICRGEVKIDSSLGLPILHLRPLSFNGFNFYFKRVVDLLISITAMSLLWPLFLIIIVLIKIDSPGPFLYDHKRVGYRGRVFGFFKFRTMVLNADVLLAKFKAMSDRKGPVFKMANDPRVTKIGRVLRKYSIDELLQLINVIRGDMSLVGPRPQVLWEAAAYDDWARRRLRVLPGITGLWQVSGRANLSYEEMIELDIYYIENWTPGLDIKILFKTLPAIFSQRGAY